MLVATQAHKPEIVPVVKNLLDSLAKGEAFTTPLSDKTTFLENEYKKALKKAEKARDKEPRSSVDIIFSSLMSGYFAPPPSTPLQHAQQATLDGINQAVARHREEPQMVAITRSLFDHIAPHEPRRVKEAAKAMLSALCPRFLGLGFEMDSPKEDLPETLNRQFRATDPMRRTLKACYTHLPS